MGRGNQMDKREITVKFIATQEQWDEIADVIAKRLFNYSFEVIGNIPSSSNFIEKIDNQQKKDDEAIPVSHLETRSSMEEDNTWDCKTNDVDILIERKKSYIAGIIDGEGAIMISKGINKRNKSFPMTYQSRISVEMCSIEIIDLFNNFFKGHIGERYTNTGKKIYSWRISSIKACKFLKIIEPYLILKQNQARLILKFQKCLRTRKNTLPLNDNEKKEREKFYQEMKALNNFNNQHPEVNVCKGEEKCSKSVGKLTEDVVGDTPTRNPLADTDDLTKIGLVPTSRIEGHRENPQDDSGVETSSAKEDNGNGTFPADSKSKIVILDDNELSLSLYAQEYPENFKAMTETKTRLER